MRSQGLQVCLSGAEYLTTFRTHVEGEIESIRERSMPPRGGRDKLLVFYIYILPSPACRCRSGLLLRCRGLAFCSLVLGVVQQAQQTVWCEHLVGWACLPACSLLCRSPGTAARWCDFSSSDHRQLWCSGGLSTADVTGCGDQLGRAGEVSGGWSSCCCL